MTASADTTTVYLLLDGTDRTVYVGVSGDGPSRLSSHATKPWWPTVASARFEHYEHRWQARQRERELIRELQPPHNTAHVGERAGPPSRLPELLATRGLSLRDIAAHCSVSQTTASRWVRGQMQIPDEQKLKLAEYFDVPVAFAMGWEEKAA